MTMMKCGHAANATEAGKPVCVVCYGIVPGADEIDTDAPDLTGRESKCGYCRNVEPSSPRLAYFRHAPDRPRDSHYCGCRGWN